MSRERRKPRTASGRTSAGEPDPLPPPHALTVDTVEAGGETLVVFAFPGKRDALRQLTEAEREIVDLILQGFTTAQIADDRGVARSTVSSQLQSIYRKLSVASRVELVCKLG